MKYYLWLKENIVRLQSKADDMLYELENVKAIRYDKQASNTNTQLINEKKLVSIDNYNRLLDKIKSLQDRFDYLEKVLAKMSLYEREMFLLKYEDGKSFQEIANKYYISKAGLFYRMQKALERIEL